MSRSVPRGGETRYTIDPRNTGSVSNGHENSVRDRIDWHFDGCVAAPPIPQISQEMRDRIAANRPHCAEARQCEAMWAAMRDWVVKNCEMKIQTIADSFIETYNSVANKLYCRVWKDPSPGGGYDFHAEFNCNYGCVINPDAPPALLLENAVNAAAAQFAQH